MRPPLSSATAQHTTCHPKLDRSACFDRGASSQHGEVSAVGKTAATNGRSLSAVCDGRLIHGTGPPNVRRRDAHRTLRENPAVGIGSTMPGGGWRSMHCGAAASRSPWWCRTRGRRRCRSACRSAAAICLTPNDAAVARRREFALGGPRPSFRARCSSGSRSSSHHRRRSCRSTTGTGADVTRRLVAPLVGGIAVSFVMELLLYPVIFSYLAKRRRLPA